jgi:hypothetical protein
MIRFLTVFINLLFFGVISVNGVVACSCSRSPAVNIEFERSQNVIIAKLISVEKTGEDEQKSGYEGIKSAKLRVEKVFKGILKAGDEVNFVQGGGADCVWTFDESIIGSEFLFYLGKKPKKNEFWYASTCSRSNSLKWAVADLLYLEKREKMHGKTRISGIFSRSIESSVEGIPSVEEILKNKNIRIFGNSKDISLKTDEKGVFEVYDLPPGKYRIEPELIEGYGFAYSEQKYLEVELKAGQQVDANLHYAIKNSLQGKFFDANGKSLEDVCLDLEPARGEKARYFFQSDCTNQNGEFKFEKIPAGSYVLVINDDGEITSDEPFGTFYYPSTTKREEAAIISIGAGDNIKDINVHAPTTVDTIMVEGYLKFSDDKPVVGESVEFHLAEAKEDASPVSRARTDEQGKFILKILKGQRGKINGSMYSYSGEYINCPSIEKIIRATGKTFAEIETPALALEAEHNLSGIELKFPFPQCEKAKIDE